MLLIVRNVTASSEEAKVIVACQEFEADLKDLLGYVFPMSDVKQRLTGLNDSAL